MKKHSLLIRQLKKYCPTGEENVPQEWLHFVDAVNEAYHSFDEDRKIIENAMELSSEEMIQINEDLRKNESVLRETISNLQKAHQELKEAQAQLLHSEKLASIGQLAAGIAHEINNPIAFVNSNMQTLEEYMRCFLRVIDLIMRLTDLMNRNELKEVYGLLEEINRVKEEAQLDFIVTDMSKLLEESRDGLERIKKIILDLRTFAREDKGEITKVSIDKILDGALNIVTNEIKYKADIEKTYDLSLPMIQCSEQKLGQVFMNLIINAAQAIEDFGVIKIKTFLENQNVCVEVSDTGKGIKEEDLLKIFDPFFTTKPIGQGTGLGLSVSHEIVRKHGGEIKVYSHLGKGTTFKVVLPVSE